MDAVVSDILKSRMQEPGGFRQTAIVSLLAHAAVVGVIVAMPGIFGPAQAAPKVIMHISLGGSPGPKTGGMTQIGGRPIVAALPSMSPTVSKPQLPVLKEEPKMTLPDPKMKSKPLPKNAAESKDPKGAPAGRGAETQAGSAKVDTRAKGQGFGLSSGGGGGDGSRLEVANFCCMEYIFEMRDRIYSVWTQQQQATGTVLIKYTILRNGTITDIQIERPSGNLLLDRESQRALSLTRLAPLPAAFSDDHLIVHLEFKYERTR
jgi:TonB family protein